MVLVAGVKDKAKVSKDMGTQECSAVQHGGCLLEALGQLNSIDSGFDARETAKELVGR